MAKSDWKVPHGYFIQELTCPVCGKTFIPAYEHIYKDGTKKVCGWNCQCEAERRKEAEKARKKAYRGKPVDPRRNDKIYLMAAKGTPLADIADAVGLSLGHVRRIINANKCAK